MTRKIFIENFESIISIISGALSLIGSSLLICTILRSKKKLSVPYRRIIFGTSVFDVFQSFGFVTSIFLSPKDAAYTGMIMWAMGNTTTCDIQGFFFTAGFIAVPFYICSLCVYYFCIIRLNMKTQIFRRVEPYLHAVPIIYSTSVSSYALANQNMNPSSIVCTTWSLPPGCSLEPDTECIRGEGALEFAAYFVVLPSAITFIIVCITMGVIAYSAMKIEKRNRRYSVSRLITSTEQEPKNEISDSRILVSTSDSKRSLGLSWKSVLHPNKEEEENHGNDEMQTPARPLTESLPISTLQQSRSKLNRSRTLETYKQALLYVGSFVLTYGSIWFVFIYTAVTGDTKPPRILEILPRIFLPMQVIMNIFIYCRPHIVSLRQKYPDKYRWFQAFWMVIKSGGDSSQITAVPRRRQTIFNKNRLMIEDDYETEFGCVSLEIPNTEPTNDETPDEADEEISDEESSDEEIQA